MNPTWMEMVCNPDQYFTVFPWDQRKETITVVNLLPKYGWVLFIPEKRCATARRRRIKRHLNA